VQAEFDVLPFDDRTFETVIFNNAFHYSTDYLAALQESLRVLKPGGLLAILDTPIYRDTTLGEQSLAERHAQLVQRTGLSTDTSPLQHVLTFDHLNTLGRDLGITWSLSWPLPAWRRILRRLQSQPSPAQFPIVFARRS